MICRICDSEDLEPVIDLGMQPWANNFLTRDQVGKEEIYPLRLLYCSQCHCVQLDYTVPKETMFADHTYVSGTTNTLRNHFLETAKTMDSKFFQGLENKAVLDIGSNDGTQLLQYKSIGYDVQGVESCGRIADMAVEAGVPTEAAFFNLETAKGLGRKFDIINASGVFFHLEELHSVTEGIREALKEDGVFVVQFLYMKTIVENMAFDQIYHEHLLYYTVETVGKILERHGLESFDAYWSPIHGGTICLMAGHKGRRDKSQALLDLLAEEERTGANTKQHYLDFMDRIRQMKVDTLEYLEARKAEGKTIYGMGAPVKGNTLLNYCGIDSRYIDYLVERNPMREGLFSPGSHLEIIMEDKVDPPPDIYFVLAWNFKKEILANNQALIDQGVEFYFPVHPKESL